MKTLTTWWIGCLLAGALFAKDDGPEALRAQVEAMRPQTHAWRGIAWQECPLEAVRLAREEGKPILVWVFLGNPSDERC